MSISIGLTGLIIIRAATTVNLGTADGFAVLAGSGITNTGATTITGDIGSYSTATITGSPTVIGTNHFGDGVTQGAKTSLATAYGNAAGQACTTNLTGQNLGGLTLTPGVYCFDSSAQLTGTLTLNGGGNPDAVFIFKIGSTLTTASASHVDLINSAQACHVFWQVGSSATFGTTTNFEGNILALTSITLNTGATVNGRVLAQNGAVTLDTNTVTKATCAVFLHLRKTMTKDNGGTALDTAWTLKATGTGGSPTNLTGTTPVDSGAIFNADTYALSEIDGPAGYTASAYSCVKNGGGAVAGNSITLVAGDNATCTINNNDIAPSLTLNKIVINNNSGVSTESAWTLTATGPTTISGSGAAGSTDVVSGATFSAGTYTLSESVGPAGYTASSWSCIKNGGAPVTGASVILGLGDVATCTITNDDIVPGTAVLTVIKTVTNNNGGTKIISNFPLFIDGMSVTSEVASTTSIGLHTVSETSDSGYTATIGGDCATNGKITLASGENKTCTITNDDIAPRLTVTKIVTNDNLGAKVISDFSFFIDGFSVSSGIASTTSAGLHTVSETSDAGYTSAITGDCAPSGAITLLPGENKFCIITNNDIAPPPSSGGGGGYSAPPVPPLIDVVKVPNPLALPAGPGLVEYTYTLRNIGIVPVSLITMIGDTCSPIVLISGDTNKNTQLDVNETWVYTCSTTLSATHTNTVVATGWSNGISATDIASAIVVVGAPIVPPLIHLVKLPNVFTLSAPGGAVTYTYTVTNPGTAPLSDVSLADDKCTGLPGRVLGHPGDTNKNDLLESNETWSFTCQSNLTKTTTNIGTVQGSANGLTARDFAIATVVVSAAVPKLPNTGLSPENKNVSWPTILLSGILVSAAVLIVFKKRTI